MYKMSLFATSLGMRAGLIAVATVAILGTTGSVAQSQTITVDISDDVIDVDPDTATVANLPGLDGHISFSEAMIASNNTPGRQTIGFAIPPSAWTYLASYFPGRAVVHTVVGNYWRASDEVTIDGRTQTAFTGDTNLNGREVVLWGSVIYLNADNCSVFGLDNSSVSVTQSNGRVEDNTATGVELFGGSGSVVRNNTGGYIQIDRSSNNVVVGNTVQRVRVLGWIANNEPAANNRIGGPTAAERNYITGLGTWNSQGWPNGFAMQIFNAVGTIIENNSIGTTPDGLQQGHAATTMGIYFTDENYDTTIRGNRIAGILGHRIGPYPGVLGQAIAIGGFGSGIRIVGNTIGLDANGEPTLGSVTGIATANYYLGPVRNIVIGGAGAGEGNEIAGHLVSGINVANALTSVRISGNSIHDNGGLGIDLITDGFVEGVTPNDPLDVDTGGNGLQNFPELTSASGTGASVTVHGVLNSVPGQAFTLEFFASAACDPSGFGEGTRFLGSAPVTTDAAGHAAFALTLPGPAAVGAAITATATRSATGDTSEFSACTTVTPGTSPIAKASATPASGSAPLVVQFSSSGSSDPDGTIVAYAWNFGDGGTSTAANPSHTYSSVGTFTATLTVTDSTGATASDTVPIVVNPGTTTLLRSTAISLSATLQGKKVTVIGDVTIADARGAAVAGAVVSAFWTKPSGTKVRQTATTNAAGVARFTTSGNRGTFTLTVTNVTKAACAFDAVNSVLTRSITK
jgi:hypothetical protein